MAKSFFERIVVPVANEDDAESTTAALLPYIVGSDATVVAVHVIEKAGGALDKASVEQREQAARDIFNVVIDGLAETDIELTTEIRYGTDIAKTLIMTAHDVKATSIVFTPRGGPRWGKLLTGDVTHNLVENSDVPVLVLPDREEDGSLEL